MTLYDRYINGSTTQVYQDIYALGQDAFLPTNLPDIEKVLLETFQRVKFNLDIIYKELKSIDYVFWKNKAGIEQALIEPSNDKDQLLEILKTKIQQFGHVPLSLEMFYKIVGNCDFAWDYKQNETILWEMSDAVQIAPLTHCVEQVTDKDWMQQAEEYVEDEDFGYAFLELSADDLHKDNISGGAPYSLIITPLPSIDSKLINEPHDTTFINYLRICFDHCGFPGLADNTKEKSYQAFFDKVRPRLKPI